LVKGIRFVDISYYIIFDNNLITEKCPAGHKSVMQSDQFDICLVILCFVRDVKGVRIMRFKKSGDQMESVTIV
jgi:hypothetical protein